MSLPFSILTPVSSSPRLDSITILTHVDRPEGLDSIWEEFDDQCMALDYETDGKEPHEGGRVVGIGLSDRRGSIYVDLKTSHPYTLNYMLRNLASHNIPLLAHNLFFEMQWSTLHPLNWLACTYATYRHLANEGWNGQEYGLKSAERDLLGWQETNELALDQWLVDNSHIASYSKEPKSGYYLLANGKYASPRKSEMHNAPPEILGHYCALDADATYQLWMDVFEPKLSKFKYLRDWLTGPYNEYIAILVRQKKRGVLVDKAFLGDYREELCNNSDTLRRELLAEFRPEMDIYNQSILDEHLTKEPNRYKKTKPLGEEPTKYRKDGEVTSRWLDWEHERTMRAQPHWRPAQSANWETWLQQYLDILVAEHFNFNSGKQREWLFYEQLGFPVVVRTETGNPATGEEALLGFGPRGRTLLNILTNDKAISSVDSLLEQLGEGSIYHPNLKCPGTHTGRLAGAGGYNWQNPPKSRYMQAFVARPGKVLISCDIASLENVVLTELSKDRTMWGLYGPEAKPNDGYLYFGSQLPIIGPIIQAAGYNPLAPTKEGISSAKKAAKKQRDIAKVIVLSSSYGAGPAKIQETLTLNGVDISLSECQEIHAAYWALLGDVKDYERELKRQWRDNSGWFLNAMGRPIGLHHEFLKDIMNRQVQSTGHDAFILFLLVTMELAAKEGIDVQPWSADVHDCWYLEVDEEEADRFCELVIQYVLPEWNFRLDGAIELKADPAIITNLWLDKAEGKALEEAKIYARAQRERLCKES